MRIRHYNAADLPACRDLWRALTETHRVLYNDPTIGGDDPGRLFDAHLNKVGRDNLWVAELDGCLVGLAGLEGSGKEAAVEPVVVDGRRRRRGIGRTLLQAVVKEARNRGIQYLSVAPVARNCDAIAFFRRSGFDKLGQIEMFMDLRTESPQQWQGSLRLHDHDFEY